MASLQSWDFYEFHFGAARLKHYLIECHDVQSQAMLLYRWNSDISAAFWESLGHLEVGLRNAIDRQMNLLHEAKGRPGNWIFDESRELGRDSGKGHRAHAYPYADIELAISRVRRNRMPLAPGQIISEISFGFWHQMVSKRSDVPLAGPRWGFPIYERTQSTASQLQSWRTTRPAKQDWASPSNLDLRPRAKI